MGFVGVSCNVHALFLFRIILNCMSYIVRMLSSERMNLDTHFNIPELRGIRVTGRSGLWRPNARSVLSYEIRVLSNALCKRSPQAASSRRLGLGLTLNELACFKLY